MEDVIDGISLTAIQTPLGSGIAIENLIIVLGCGEACRTLVGCEEDIGSCPFVLLVLRLAVRQLIGALGQVLHIVLSCKRCIDFKTGLEHTAVTYCTDLLRCHARAPE